MERRPYFVSLPVDVAMMGGLSLALYALLWAIGARSRTSEVISLGATLVWIINYPHFSATSHRLYGSRDHIRQYPLTACVVPVVLLAGAFLSLQSPLGVAPYFVKFFQIWSPYHFSGQTFGLAMLYARRMSFTMTPGDRRLLRWFIYSTYLSLVATIETGVRRYQFYGVTFPTVGLPEWVAQAAWYAMLGLGVLVLIRLVVMRAVRRQTPPWMVLLPAATQFVWFGLGQQLPSFAEFIPAFHSLQYLLVAWSVQLKTQLDESRHTGSRGFVVDASVRWLATNILGGVALFWGLPHAATAIGGFDINLTTAVFFAAIQIHHFFVDGVIWKLKNPRVLSPLLVNLDELLHPQNARVAAPAGTAS